MRFASEVDGRGQQRRRKIRLHGAMQAFVDAPVARHRHAAQRDLHQQFRGHWVACLFRAQQPLRRGLRRRRAGNPVQPYPRVFDLRLDMPGLSGTQKPTLRVVHALRIGQCQCECEGLIGRTAFGRGLQFDQHCRSRRCRALTAETPAAASRWRAR